MAGQDVPRQAGLALGAGEDVKGFPQVDAGGLARDRLQQGEHRDRLAGSQDRLQGDGKVIALQIRGHVLHSDHGGGHQQRLTEQRGAHGVVHHALDRGGEGKGGVEHLQHPTAEGSAGGPIQLGHVALATPEAGGVAELIEMDGEIGVDDPEPDPEGFQRQGRGGCQGQPSGPGRWSGPA